MWFDNVAKAFLVLGALSLSAGLSGCGGSGGDPDGASPTPTPGPSTTPTPVPVTGSTSYLFYTGSISAVDPAAPTSPITVEAGTDIVRDSESTVIAGTYDAATKTLNNIHAHAIVYAKSDGKLYKARAFKSSGTPTPTQLSSETAAGKCDVNDRNTVPGYLDYFDFANPDNTAIVYRTPGANGTCNNSDDVFKMARLGMSATDAPVVAKEPVESLNDVTTGALTGWLVNDAGALKRCDANFANCTSLRLITNYADSLSSNLGGSNRMLLNIDNALYVYDGNANTLSAAIYTGSNLSHTIFISDAGNIYFLPNDAPKSIYVAPVDGSASATVLLTDAADIRFIRFTANKLLYTTATETKTTAKTGGAATTLLNSGSLWTVNGNHVYYVYLNGTVLTAGMIDDDGNNKSETANAYWIGMVFGASWSIADGFYSPSVQAVIRAEGNALGAGTGYAGATLRSFNAASKAEVGVLGTVPTDINSFFCLGREANTLCRGSNSTQTDVFLLNAETPGSLVRVTNTPTKSEYPL